MTYPPPNERTPAMPNMITLNPADIRGEAKRLNELGALRLTWRTEGLPMTSRDKQNKLRCIGYAIDSEERECLLFIGPYGPRLRFCVRSIPAKMIETIEVLGAIEEGRSPKASGVLFP